MNEIGDAEDVAAPISAVSRSLTETPTRPHHVRFHSRLHRHQRPADHRDALQTQNLWIWRSESGEALRSQANRAPIFSTYKAGRLIKTKKPPRTPHFEDTCPREPTCIDR
jgi:hypothetical protein